MERSMRIKNKMSNNLRMKASSLYFLNDISNIDSHDCNSTTVNWRDEYTFNPVTIGRGHFSKVYKVKCSSSSNTFAVKVIRRRRMGTDKIDEIMQEIEIMNLSNKSSNSGFLQLFKVHTNPSEVAIVMEFASGGALYNVAMDSQDGLPDIYVRIVLTKVLNALSVLHHQDIVHLDIKADNILLRYPYPSTDVVLSDFGLARKLSKSKIHREMIGTPDYVAPEVVNYEEICLKSDMWSIGVLAYFLLTNISPFSGHSKEDTLHRVTKTNYEFDGQLKEDHMKLARTFISSLLVKAPEARLSAADCLVHDFLSDIPIVECSLDRSAITDVQVMNLDYEVHVRENTFCHARGMVMSQYDIDSVHNKRNLVESNKDIFKANSSEAIGTVSSMGCVDCPDLPGHDESEGVFLKDMTESVYSIDQCNGNEQINDCYKDVTEVEYMIDLIRNTSFTKRVTDDDKLLISETNVQYSVDIQGVRQDCSLTENVDSLSEMTNSSHEFTSTDSTGHSTDTSTTESCSVFIKVGSYKENHLPNRDIVDDDIVTEMNFQNPTKDPSRQRSNGVDRLKGIFPKNSLINASFRNSREDIIDNYSSETSQHCHYPRLLNSCNTLLSDDDKTATIPSVNEGLKRKSLIRSLKKDVDKPQMLSDKSKRQSELLLNSKNFHGNGSVYGYRNVSLSNPILTTRDIDDNVKRSTLKFPGLFKSKRCKEPRVTKWNCIVC